MERHLPQFYNGTKQLITTFWPTGTTTADIVQYLQQALVAKDAAMVLGQSAVDVLLKNGILAKLVVKNGKVITFYPLSGPGVTKAADVAKALH